MKFLTNFMIRQQERFAAFLKRELNGFLQNHVERKNGTFLSLQRIESRGKSDKAEVFVSVFPEKEGDVVFKNIKNLGKAARKYIASRSGRHFVPEIQFKLEKNEASQIRLEKLLEKVKNE